ncbi:hypothetical protein CEUSTIGMA_g12436.t1 [Chlamydomonas eustigma]|uniref:Uncharacterized protein n=1 Tax=Chlamydomonas eustigma TaxID=1157962 RepID=A0A250XPL9_9CHLO|nr:hypothetical protein CEUSTIGMA_g12436.t1 [Chlamydomonas eustigma]|eukprot:GAX85015.1 hypothetical protein CEUSTIGMA_g12436.t1 [Chlamydomonas eustigma]
MGLSNNSWLMYVLFHLHSLFEVENSTHTTPPAVNMYGYARQEGDVVQPCTQNLEPMDYQGVPNLYWRSIPMEDLRLSKDYPHFVGLPPPEGIQLCCPWTFRLLRQDSEQWSRLHAGVLSTGSMADLLGFKEVAAASLLRTATKGMTGHGHFLHACEKLLQLPDKHLWSCGGELDFDAMGRPSLPQTQYEAVSHLCSVAGHERCVRSHVQRYHAQYKNGQARHINRVSHALRQPWALLRQKRCAAVAQGGAGSVRMAWGSVQEGAALSALMRLFPESTVHEVGFMAIPPQAAFTASTPAAVAVAGRPPLLMGASPDGIICHRVAGMPRNQAATLAAGAGAIISGTQGLWHTRDQQDHHTSEFCPPLENMVSFSRSLEVVTESCCASASFDKSSAEGCSSQTDTPDPSSLPAPVKLLARLGGSQWTEPLLSETLSGSCSCCSRGGYGDVEPSRSASPAGSSSLAANSHQQPAGSSGAGSAEIIEMLKAMLSNVSVAVESVQAESAVLSNVTKSEGKSDIKETAGIQSSACNVQLTDSRSTCTGSTAQLRVDITQPRAMDPCIHALHVFLSSSPVTLLPENSGMQQQQQIRPASTPEDTSSRFTALGHQKASSQKAAASASSLTPQTPQPCCSGHQSPEVCTICTCSRCTVLVREVVEVKNTCPFAFIPNHSTGGPQRHRHGYRRAGGGRWVISDRGPRDQVSPLWIPQLQLHMLASGCLSALLVSHSATKGTCVYRVYRDESYLTSMLSLAKHAHAALDFRSSHQHCKLPSNLYSRSDLKRYHHALLHHTLRISRSAHLVARIASLNKPCDTTFNGNIARSAVS